MSPLYQPSRLFGKHGQIDYIDIMKPYSYLIFFGYITYSILSSGSSHYVFAPTNIWLEWS